MSKTSRAPCATTRAPIARTTCSWGPPSGGENDMTVFDNLGSNFIAAVVFALLGVILFVVGFIIFDKITPGSLWKELLEDQNTALGVLMAGVAIAIAIIIAAAIH